VIFADLVNFESLTPFAIFGLFAVIAWWVLGVISTGKPRAEQRLEQIKNPRSRSGRLESSLKKQDALSRMIEKASPALAKPLEPKSDLEKSKLKIRLANAGFRGDGAATVFLGLKFAGLIVGLTIGGAAAVGAAGINQKSLMMMVFVGGCLFYLPEIALKFLVSRRQMAVFLGLPDALDLLVVCVEAGLGLDQAMRRVSEEMLGTHRVIAEEFGVANFQLQMGRTRNEVLHELGVRTGVADLRGLAAVLIQADKFGSSIAQALRVQSNSMRTRRRQIAEEKAAKTAVQLIFPLVLFIFPGIFVVLVGPAAITMIKEMFPLMEAAS